MKGHALTVLAWIGIVTLSTLYTIVAVHTPLTLMVYHAHDDGLYMLLGQYLANGEWLGPFNQFTLMKGPGYPLFLAGSHWLGVPISFTRAVFHCVAITAAVVLFHRFVKIRWLSAVLFVLLLWHPLPATAHLNRILRETIYYGQVLLFLALFASMLFGDQARRAFVYAGLGGGVLGWLWLTREEGIWLIPGMAVLLAAAAWRAARASRLRELAWALLVMVAVFSATQGTFRAVNRVYYKSFIGVDLKETQFQRALKTLHSVRSGGIQPFVSVTRAARQNIYAVSPAFRSLAGQLDGDLGKGWSVHNCRLIPSTCGELGSGWFMWALRDAVAGIGGYASPERASAFYKRLANEITTACAKGILKCRPQFVPEMPPVNWEQFARFPQGFANTLAVLLLPSLPSAVNPSGGDPTTFARRLTFLNFPRHAELPNAPKVVEPYIVRGWYYKSGSEWFTVTVTDPNGLAAAVKTERSGSPDLVPTMPGAVQQRFSIRTQCTDDCVLALESADHVKLNKKLGELRGRSFFPLQLGSGTFLVEAAEAAGAAEPRGESAPDRMSRAVRETIIGQYNRVFMPLLVLGVLAFVLVAIGYRSQAISNVCFLLAVACWLLVVARITLVVIVDITSFPSVSVAYLSPAYFLTVCATVFSIAAWAQIRRIGEAPTDRRMSSGLGHERADIVSHDVSAAMR